MGLIRVKVGKKTFRVKDCKGLSSVKGLMFDKLNDKDGALIYANNIWMPFVKKKLNLIFLDKNMKVLSQQIAAPLTANTNSWKVYKNKKARYCLELKDCTLKVKGKTEVKVV